MLDVLELERKWSKYHFKKILPLYIVSFVTASLIAVSAYLYTEYPDTIVHLFNTERDHKEELTVVEINKSIEPKHPIQPHLQPLVQPSPRNVLMPSFNFLYNLEDYVININHAQRIASVVNEEPSKPEPKAKKTEPNTKKSKPKKRSKPKPKPKPKKVSKKAPVVPAKAKKSASVPIETKVADIEPVQSIIIGDSKPPAVQEQQPLLQVSSTNTSEDELRSLIKRFNNNKNPALSLFLSKKYYENSNFKESYVYAKETYKLNPNIEDGVLLYAQSSVKLGKKDEATAKLKLYIKHSGSIKAKTLLNEIQKGTFK